jgi:MoxR-like ATPase
MSDDGSSFVGRGDADQVLKLTGNRPMEWQPYDESDGERKLATGDHPEGYIAHQDVVAAVNTALVLGKPLLLSGNPGTGKTQLADRIAWELGLGAVLRFEAQSISEAQDLFYRYDLVGQMARAHLQSLPQYANTPIRGVDFVAFGPLGRAILRASPLPTGREAREGRLELLKRAFPAEQIGADWVPRRSVVLIDEIDKASRDFPNDLLNAIERLELRIRELPQAEGNVVRVSEDAALRPIVVITSNGEREIPAPFLRRCVFCHIPDPDRNRLREIVWNRVLSDLEKKPGGGGDAAPPPLPPLFEELLGVFDTFRKDDQSFAYRPGPAELVDWSRAIHRHKRADRDSGLAVNKPLALETSSAVAKNQRDRERLLDLFKAILPPVSKTASS